MKTSIFSKKPSLTSKGHPEGQMLLKWCMLMLYGPKSDKKLVELKFQCYIINLQAFLI